MAIGGEAALALYDLSVAFDGLKAVTNLSFNASQGSIVALVGPNGAGKTTVFNLICGYLKPDTGSIRIAGQPATRRRPDAVARMGVGRTFQNGIVFEQISVLDNVRLGMRDAHHETWFSALRRGRSFCQAEVQKQDRARILLSKVGLLTKEDSLACDLSYGQRKLLELCRVQAFDPQVFLLDEPFAGLFPDTAAEMAQTIRGLRNAGRTVVFIEHDMDKVAQMADRVIVMDFGRLIADGSPQRVLNDAAVLDAYLGRTIASAA